MTRWLEQTCDKCGGKKEVYYGAWCSLCDRPEVIEKPTLNYLQVVRHIERKHNLDDDHLTGHSRSLWMFIIEYIKNDVYVSLPFNMWLEEDDGPDENGEYWSYDGKENYTKAFELMKLIAEEYKDIDLDNVLWEISW